MWRFWTARSVGGETRLIAIELPGTSTDISFHNNDLWIFTANDIAQQPGGHGELWVPETLQPAGSAATDSSASCLARSLPIDQTTGGFRSQLRITLRVSPQSSSCNSLSFHQGGSQPNEMS